MKLTKHVQKRMNTRGITKEMIDFTLNFGEIKGDGWMVNRKALQELIKDLEHQMKTAKKLLDKGGIIVIAEDNALLTTYHVDSAHRAY